MVPKRVGEITARRAAHILDVHERTARRWCKSNKFETARHDIIVNRYYVTKLEVMRVKERGWPLTE